MANGSTHLSTWVTADIKQRFATLAAAHGFSESGLLKRSVMLLLQSVDAEHLAAPIPSATEARHSRLTIRLRPDDERLLKERALGRGIPAATYVAAVVRVHLSGQAPLPKKELAALLQVVGDLRAIGRNLHQIARATNQGARLSGPSRDDLRAILTACEALREHVHDLVKANLDAWETGNVRTTRQR